MGVSHIALERTIVFSLVEIGAMLRSLRETRDSLTAAQEELEERVKSGHNGRLTAAFRVIEAEVYIHENIVKKLWAAFNAEIVAIVTVKPIITPPD